MTYYGSREKCYKCYRPKNSCMCKHIKTIDTKTKFIILMHTKEFKKTKNTTGFLTHLSLKNSEIFIGIDFTNHERVNEIIKEYNSFVLYPSDDAINISKSSPITITDSDKKMAVFIIDSTWSCSKAMLRSKNLQNLKFISFDNTKLSQFEIKEQPASYYLSTIESSLYVLKELDKLKVENISKNSIDNFLNPFFKMINYQKRVIKNQKKNTIRFKSRDNS